MINIRSLKSDDAQLISDAFTEQGWSKPTKQFERYYNEQQEEKRYVLVAEHNHDFAGYITIVWESNYEVFKKNGVPEIMDFNVLEKYQRRGIGKKLILAAEELIKEKSDTAGIRVGLLKGYGAAQRLYVKLGYIPDGKGISKDNYFYNYFEETVVDDDLTIGFMKAL